ncbi:MAG: hypothetical protein M1822_000596 [Bathelium mastoideum]|nr:MAG: hypothetical protein M1822_000596 [Bathelium mastoideum]
MFSEQSDLAQIEVVTHLIATVGRTIQLSGNSSLRDVQDDCQTLRDLQRRGWTKWLENIDELEEQSKQVLSSHSVAFHISPAVHNAFIHGTKARPNVQNTGEEDPNSLSFWRLSFPQASGGELDCNESNPTIFPTAFLRSHKPILLIRHPALAFPSTVRTASRFFDFVVSETFMHIILRYRWHRMIYEWYDQDSRKPGGSPTPIVLDADELMYDRAALNTLCAQTGLDPQAIKYEWASMSHKEIQMQYEGEAVFLETLLGSNGIVSGKGSDGVEVECEMEGWREEFGEERAEMLRRMVEAAMEDYMFLKSRGLRSDKQFIGF